MNSTAAIPASSTSGFVSAPALDHVLKGRSKDGAQTRHELQKPDSERSNLATKPLLVGLIGLGLGCFLMYCLWSWSWQTNRRSSKDELYPKFQFEPQSRAMGHNYHLESGCDVGEPKSKVFTTTGEGLLRVPAELYVLDLQLKSSLTDPIHALQQIQSLAVNLQHLLTYFQLPSTVLHFGTVIYTVQGTTTSTNTSITTATSTSTNTSTDTTSSSSTPPSNVLVTALQPATLQFTQLQLDGLTIHMAELQHQLLQLGIFTGGQHYRLLTHQTSPVFTEAALRASAQAQEKAIVRAKQTPHRTLGALLCLERSSSMEQQPEIFLPSSVAWPVNRFQIAAQHIEIIERVTAQYSLD